MEPLVLSVEDLEDYIEGFTNVFDEDDEIEVTTKMTELSMLDFDETF